MKTKAKSNVCVLNEPLPTAVLGEKVKRAALAGCDGASAPDHGAPEGTAG